MKKNLMIALIILLVLALAGAGAFFVLRSKKAVEEVITPESKGVLIETTLEERPYVTLTPRDDGRELTLSISRIKNAQTIEYELVYLSAGLSRGVIGSVDLKGETTVERNLLLGSCSRNVCKYDEDVSEGTLILRFRGPDGVRKFVTDFHLQQKDETLTSVDGNFQIEGKISPTAFYLTMATIGLPASPAMSTDRQAGGPEEIEGQTISEIYGVFTAGNKTIKNSIVTLTLAEESPTASLYSWDGKVWQKEEKGFETDGKTVSATINQLATFVVTTSK